MIRKFSMAPMSLNLKENTLSTDAASTEQAFIITLSHVVEASLGIKNPRCSVTGAHHHPVFKQGDNPDTYLAEIHEYCKKASTVRDEYSRTDETGKVYPVTSLSSPNVTSSSHHVTLKQLMLRTRRKGRR